MINALLLSLLCQDPEVSVQARAHRQEGQYELTLTGKGKGLRDQEIVSLKFRRFENRVNWADGAITTQPTATATRALGFLADTSTMRASPASPRCVRLAPVFVANSTRLPR